MDIYMIALRLIHIVSGVFWAGGSFFMISVLVPTVRAAGPDGGKFMQHLAASGSMSARFGVTAFLTTLSGLLMHWRLFDVAGAAYFQTGPGIVLTIGALAGLAAFLHGLFGTGRVSGRMGVLAREMLALQGPPSPEQINEAQLLARKLSSNAVVTAGLLIIAVAGMAIFPYFG